MVYLYSASRIGGVVAKMLGVLGFGSCWREAGLYEGLAVDPDAVRDSAVINKE
jgi:hypothetical protein